MYSNFTDNFAKWTIPAMMKKYEFGQEEELRKQKEATADAVLASTQAGDISTKSAEAGAWQGYQPRTVGDYDKAILAPEDMPYGEKELSAQGAEAMRLGGQARFNALEGIATQKLQEIKEKQVGEGIKNAEMEMRSFIAGSGWTDKRIDSLVSMINIEKKAGREYPSQKRDYFLAEINKARSLTKQGPLTAADLENMKDFRQREDMQNQELIIGQHAKLLDPNTPVPEKIKLAGHLRVAIPEMRKRAEDPNAYKDMDGDVTKAIENILKPPEKPLRALKTIYGPNGQTQEVEVGANFVPPQGWSLQSPGAEKDMNPVYARIENQVNRSAHIEAITKTKQKFGGGVQLGVGPDGSPVITSFGNDDAEKYYTETKASLLQTKMDRAIKLKQLPEDYRTVATPQEKPPVENKVVQPLSPEKMKAAEVIRAQFRAGKIKQAEAEKQLQALGMK